MKRISISYHYSVEILGIDKDISFLHISIETFSSLLTFSTAKSYRFSRLTTFLFSCNRMFEPGWISLTFTILTLKHVNHRRLKVLLLSVVIMVYSWNKLYLIYTFEIVTSMVPRKLEYSLARTGLFQVPTEV